MAEQTGGFGRWAIAAAFVVVVAGAWWALSRGSSEEAAPIVPTASVEITPRGTGVAGWVIEPGTPLAIAKAALPRRGIVPLDLRLPDPAPGQVAVHGRVLSVDEDRSNRERPLNGKVVGEGRATARVGVAADFLVPDSYQIEIDGGEPDGEPLRYRLEVR